MEAGDDAAATWVESERPKPIPPARLKEILTEVPPAESFGGFMVAVSIAVGELYSKPDPADELERRIAVVKHRGRHVLQGMRSGALLEASGWDSATLERVIERARSCMDLTIGTEADIVERLEVVLELVRAKESDLLAPPEVAMMAHLVLLSRPELRLANTMPEEEFAELLQGLKPKLLQLRRHAPGFMALVGDELSVLVRRAGR